MGRALTLLIPLISVVFYFVSSAYCLSNSVAPSIIFIDRSKPSVSCTVGECEPSSIDPELHLCESHINLGSQAIDDSTEVMELIFRYKIDLYNDGIGSHDAYDLVVGPLSKMDFLKGHMSPVNDNPFSDQHGNPFNASGVYPIGIHKICWYVKDLAGNVGTCCTLFEIKDCVAPEINVITSKSYSMHPTGCIDIWAKDLNIASTDNCSDSTSLKFFFNNDPNQTSIRICCEDFTRAQSACRKIKISLVLNVEDGNSNIASVSIITEIADNLDVCPVGDTRIKAIWNAYDRGKCIISPTTAELFRFNILIDSNYRLNSLFYYPDFLKQFKVKLEKEDNPSNGICIADIFILDNLISNRIQAKDDLTKLAADVDNSGKIDFKDLKDLKCVLLQKSKNFYTGNSWKFYRKENADKSYEDLWNKFDTIFFPDTCAHILNYEFLGFKIGDLNGDAIPNPSVKKETDYKGKLKFNIHDKELKEGQEYEIKIYSNDFKNISGFQLGWNLKFENLEIIKLNNGQLIIPDENINSSMYDQGFIPMIWYSNNQITIDENKELFSIVVKAKSDIRISENIGLWSEVLNPIAYSLDLQPLSLDLGFLNHNGESLDDEIELLKIKNNVVSDYFIFEYKVFKDQNLEFEIFNAEGRTILKKNIDARKGMNHIKVFKDEIGIQGICFYKLGNKIISKSGKIILL